MSSWGTGTGPRPLCPAAAAVCHAQQVDPLLADRIPVHQHLWAGTTPAPWIIIRRRLADGDGVIPDPLARHNIFHQLESVKGVAFAQVQHELVAGTGAGGERRAVARADPCAQPTRGRCVSIFLDKNRRYIGKSQPKRPPKRTPW
eukprot:COSAG01_NODE_12651_length_1704_cov_1.047352_1_plen_144_part_10